VRTTNAKKLHQADYFILPLSIFRILPQLVFHCVFGKACRLRRETRGAGKELNHLLDDFFLDPLSHGDVVLLHSRLIFNHLFLPSFSQVLFLALPSPRLLTRRLDLLPILTLISESITNGISSPLLGRCRLARSRLCSLLCTVSCAAFGKFPGEFQVEIALFDAQGGDAVTDAAD
jgi:hypothetical protein